MNDPTKAGGDCCHPAKQVDVAPAPVDDCCHAPAMAEPVAPPTHDCCHAGAVAPVARVARPGESLYFCPMCPGVENQAVDGLRPPLVFVTKGEVLDQVADRLDPDLGQQLGPVRAHAAYELDGLLER